MLNWRIERFVTYVAEMGEVSWNSLMMLSINIRKNELKIIMHYKWNKKYRNIMKSFSL
jgi:hypothetical protein